MCKFASGFPLQAEYRTLHLRAALPWCRHPGCAATWTAPPPPLGKPIPFVVLVGSCPFSLPPPPPPVPPPHCGPRRRPPDQAPNRPDLCPSRPHSDLSGPSHDPPPSRPPRPRLGAQMWALSSVYLQIGGSVCTRWGNRTDTQTPKPTGKIPSSLRCPYFSLSCGYENSHKSVCTPRQALARSVCKKNSGLTGQQLCIN